MNTLEQKIAEIRTYYVNSDITSANFPKPKKLRDINKVKVIKMPKSFTSEEGLAEMKKQGCSPMNIWEVVEWIRTGKAEKSNWYVALDEEQNLCPTNFGIDCVCIFCNIYNKAFFDFSTVK